MAPAYVTFLLMSAPGTWRSMFRPRIVLLALAAAAIGASQYLWNLTALWSQEEPPATLAAGVARFWFDVTKADWRGTMILNVPASMALERLRMYAFDLRQQFGWFVPAMAVAGVMALYKTAPRRAALLAIAYAANVVFALCYNVGDAHVFFLPSHLMVALFAAAAIPALGRAVSSPQALVAVLLIFTAARIYRENPALDRSGDDRAARALGTITAGTDDRRDVLLIDMNWQLENGLNYFARHDRPETAYVRFQEVAPHALALIRDNAAIGRNMTATARARDQLEAAFGPRITSVRDHRGDAPTLMQIINGLPDGAPYILCSLRPSREFQLTPDTLETSLARLTAGRLTALPPHDYAFVAGLAGSSPMTIRVAHRPFRQVFPLDRMRVEVRMDAWLSFDTIRRMGFGHVIADRRHALIVERGLSLVALDRSTGQFQTAYEANVFAPQPRYLVKFEEPSLVP
jgi:hypothetical protein